MAANDIAMTKEHRDKLQAAHVEILRDLEVQKAVDSLFTLRVLDRDAKDDIAAEGVCTQVFFSQNILAPKCGVVQI